MNDLNPELLIREARDWLREGEIGLVSEEFILGLIVALEAATKPRTVTTVEELDALPVGSVIRTSEGRVSLLTEKWSSKLGDNAIVSSWYEADEGEWAIPSDELDDLPATIPHTPEAMK